MKTIEQVQVTIQEFLDQYQDEAPRLAAIADLERAIGFERRLAELSDEDREAMHRAGEARLSDEQRAAIDAASTDEKRAAIMQSIARANYMTQCHWADYLNGVSSAKPIPRRSDKLAA
jgi:hypothetical protein